MLTTPAQPKPWSALQSPASLVGQSPDGRVHMQGVRWDIVNNADGSTQELGVFGDAFVTPEAVQDVYLGIEPFSDKPGGQPGHAQLHFKFRPDAPVTDGQGHSDSGLVLSVEPRFYQGEPWTPGGQEPQPVLYQLGTWTDSIEKVTLHNHYPLELYRLELNHQQKVALLKERLQVSGQDHSKDIYHPVTNSCISSLIEGVNKVVPPEQKIPRTDPNCTIPVWCPKSFKKYKLLQKTKPDIAYPEQPK